jgi:V8-like Glu-specific endopeptidase
MNSPFLDEALFVADEPRVAASTARSPFEAALEFVEREAGVISGDNRKRVTPTTGVPWRWICRIDVLRNGQPQPEGGTGVLISNRHVLTAAHVVFDAAQNMQNFSITVKPGLDYGNEPFGSSRVMSRPRMASHYRPDAADRLDFDYALLTLENAVGENTFKALGGNALCFWGSSSCGAKSVFARRDPAKLNLQPIMTAGYPDSSGQKTLMCAPGKLHSADAKRRTMLITADTTKGQSGSPIWITKDGAHCLVGIAVAADSGSNIALRVTRELIRQLREWITADGENPAMTENEAADQRARHETPEE